MSGIRILGIIIGIIGLSVTFLVYRGPQWKRANFLLFCFFSLGLVTVSINPNVVNSISDVLYPRQVYQSGRLLTLIVLAVLFLAFYSLNTKYKLENIRIQFDKLVRNLGADEVVDTDEIRKRIKPIMVLIPAYNEEENLKELLPSVPKDIKGIEVGVLVIDDASEDGTMDVAKRHGHLVVANCINRGQGAASRLGYDLLEKFGVSIGVTMDADNQHRPADLEKLVTPILESDLDLVIGSRTMGRYESDGLVRPLGIKLLSFLISLAIGERITDCSSGFKAFRIHTLKQLNLTEDQFQSAEVIIEATKRGLKVAEVPISINRRKHGESKKGTNWRYGIQFSKVIFKTWWRG